jgi:uncharacterized protein
MNYKLSYYTLFSDPVDGFNSRIAFSSRTSRSLKITDACYEFMQNGLISYIPDIVVNTLKEYMLVVPADENELTSVITENKEGMSKIAAGPVLYEVIQPTAYCQLGCYYCGQQHTKTNLTDDLTDKIVERITSKFHNGTYSTIYIGWFGGEPLVGLPQMRLINQKLRTALNGTGAKVSGKIITNGLSLKENIFLELVNDFNINRIEVTLDGTAEYHDQHRFTKANGPSFDIIYGNLQKITDREDFSSYNCALTVRCNVDEKNIEGVAPLIEKIAADGMHTKIAALYFMGIYSWGGNDAHKKSLTKESFAQLELEWMVLKRKLGYKHRIDAPARRMQTCIAVGGVSELYDAKGNIYNCTEISYSDVYENAGYKLGHLSTQHLERFQDKPFNNWFDEIHDGRQEPCQQCRLLPVCGGACPKAWKENNMPCPPFKYNMKKKLELKYIIKSTAEEELNEKLDIFMNAFKPADFERLY